MKSATLNIWWLFPSTFSPCLGSLLANSLIACCTVLLYIWTRRFENRAVLIVAHASSAARWAVVRSTHIMSSTECQYGSSQRVLDSSNWSLTYTHIQPMQLNMCCNFRNTNTSAQIRFGQSGAHGGVHSFRIPQAIAECPSYACKCAKSTVVNYSGWSARFAALLSTLCTVLKLPKLVHIRKGVAQYVTPGKCARGRAAKKTPAVQCSIVLKMCEFLAPSFSPRKWRYLRL